MSKCRNNRFTNPYGIGEWGRAFTKKPLAPFPKRQSDRYGQKRDAEEKDHDPEAQGGPGAQA